MANKCKYRSDDGMCALFTSDLVTSYCVDGPCPYEEAPHKTNADRIRAMNDEELAEWICEFSDCDYRCPIGGANISCVYGCAYALLVWLKQEVSE